ncbi:hypothetical protein BDN70DRAFT_111543 [Pholiota conissans]|uniref:Uncharacterized protein n=1 Tax=Pholiota conissans TaxID=109636 RepID=A0A9P5YZJ9_9AGAR|nr:hypothetical protein BDN70DRAFT_111543 [Pholiota conissans]
MRYRSCTTVYEAISSLPINASLIVFNLCLMLVLVYRAPRLLPFELDVRSLHSPSQQHQHPSLTVDLFSSYIAQIDTFLQLV